MGIGEKTFLCLLLIASTFLASGESNLTKSDVVQPTLPEFCGNSTFAECKEDADCKIGGCSGEICGGIRENLVSICVYKDCYNREKFNVQCRCVNNRCQWVQSMQTPIPITPVPVTPIPVPPIPPDLPRKLPTGEEIVATRTSISVISPKISISAKEEKVYMIPEKVGRNVTSVTSITLIPAESTEVKISVERFKEIPPDVPKIQGMAMLILFDIRLEMTKVTSVGGKVEFAVPIEALKGIDPKRIVALRLVDNKWIELSTRFLGEKNGYYHFLAETQGFSYFALALKPEVTPTPTPEKEIPKTSEPEKTEKKKIGIPGFNLTLAIVSFAVLILLRRKK